LLTKDGQHDSDELCTVSRWVEFIFYEWFFLFLGFSCIVVCKQAFGLNLDHSVQSASQCCSEEFFVFIKSY
jgi:hypothetical protein